MTTGYESPRPSVDGSRPRLSVVICTRNRALELREAIASVQTQEVDNFEIVVVDDGSTDLAVRDAVARLADGRVRYVRRENGGLSAARNTGVAEAHGDYIVFLDDDDVALPGWLASLAEAVATDDCAVACCGAVWVRDDGRPGWVELPGPLGPAFDDQRGLFKAGTFAVRRDVYLEVGGFAEEVRVIHQTEFALRLLPLCRERGWTVRSVDRPLVRLLSRHAVHRTRSPDELLAGIAFILQRHGERLARAPQLLANFLATAGVAAVRAGDYRRARHYLRRAATVPQSSRVSWKNHLRWAVACVPPVAARVWRAEAYGLHDRDRGPQGDRGIVGPALVVYRGPFQGRRLRFLLDVVVRLHGDANFAWLNPDLPRGGPADWFEKFAAERGGLERHVQLDGSGRGLLGSVLELRRLGGRRPAIVYAIGFTALPYARALRPRRLVWSINGVPEERLVHRGGVRAQLPVRARWWSARVGRRPDVVVTVSAPMGRLVARRMSGMRWLAAPTCVELETFRAVSTRPRAHCTYVGTGAPWQGLDRVATVWAAMARMNTALRFRVVSRDERARRAVRDVPPDRSDVRAAHAPAEVAALLAEASLGFLIRTPGVVNETSFPTKFGEYVAAGVPVVATDVGWEISDIIRRTGCGIVLDPTLPAETMAEHIVEFERQAASPDVVEGCRRAAAELERAAWVDRLSGALSDMLGQGVR